jgi:hypothetical protein
MALLDTLLNDIGGRTGGNASPILGVLSSLLGGNQSGGGIAGMLGGGGQGGMGGLQGLLSKFEGAGLGGLAQSWGERSQSVRHVRTIGRGSWTGPGAKHGDAVGDGAARSTVAAQPAPSRSGRQDDAEWASADYDRGLESCILSAGWEPKNEMSGTTERGLAATRTGSTTSQSA